MRRRCDMEGDLRVSPRLAFGLLWYKRSAMYFPRTPIRVLVSYALALACVERRDAAFTGSWPEIVLLL